MATNKRWRMLSKLRSTSHEIISIYCVNIIGCVFIKWRFDFPTCCLFIDTSYAHKCTHIHIRIHCASKKTSSKWWRFAIWWHTWHPTTSSIANHKTAEQMRINVLKKPFDWHEKHFKRERDNGAEIKRHCLIKSNPNWNRNSWNTKQIRRIHSGKCLPWILAVYPKKADSSNGFCVNKL